MENYISLLVATLQHFELLTEKEAERLDKELRNSTIPGTYKEAKIVVSEAIAKVKKGDYTLTTSTRGKE